MSKKDINQLQTKFLGSGVPEHKLAILEEENIALKQTVSKLLVEIDRLHDKEQGSDIIELGPITSEMLIIEKQIQFLKATALTRMLSLEETKILDIHIKNKRLLEGSSTSILDAEFKSLPANMSDEELLRIAESVESSKIPEPGSK